ncbi:ATP-binding protein [Candidatus Methylopumilus turicensis]|uniref:histidine kinase n=1 Tax=Candidatus Methylopumilus turicensis TaxID=1581680 RepID=A0A0B7IUR6_9PROT|nr:ATP-binding protein [Candidatus Methylopumilus turicensis]CEN56046.1 Integral membrane sensor signal transduction histidine kinase [Candidatus Methylopumilus turicensis]
MSLRLRLNLLITALSLAFMLAAGWVIVNDAKVSIRERVEAASRVTVQLLDNVIVTSVMNPSLGETTDVLNVFLRSLGYVRSNQITLFDSRGNVLYESPQSTYQTDVHPPQWFVKIVEPKQESVQRRVRFGTLVITSSAAGSIRQTWRGVEQLMWIGLGFFLILNIMVYALLSYSLRPVGSILSAINRMEQGDLKVRLEPFKLPEFETIGHSLNRMAESLEAERQLEENRQLTALIQSHIEDERRSLARELHDELGQYVTAIKTFAVGIANKTVEKMPDVSSNAQTIVAAANHIYDGMHNIIRHLRPGALDNLGLSETLKDAINHLQKQHPEVEFKLNLSGELDALGENLNINFYRIVQESLNNAVKHAKASIIHVSLKQDLSGNVNLIIQDNGVGMEVDKVDQTQHFGLLGMRERTQAFRGQFDIQSSSKGTKISIHLPKESIT